MSHVEHVVIYLKGELLLLKRSVTGQYEVIEKAETPAIQERYVLIKTITHIAIELSKIISDTANGDLQESQVTDTLAEFREELVKLKQNYPIEVQSELHVINLMLSYIDRTSSGFCASDLQGLNEKYLNKMNVHFDRYIEETAKLQIDGMRQIMKTWVKEKFVNLISTYIVIIAARAPKKGLLERQVVDDMRLEYGLNDQNTESGGVIVTEMLAKHMNQNQEEVIADVLLDLGVDLSSQDVALNVLGDRSRMHEDVLSTATKEILDRKNSTSIPSVLETIRVRFLGAPVQKHDSKSVCPFHRIK